MENIEEQVDVPKEQKEDGSDELQEGTASAVSPSQTSTSPRNQSQNVMEESSTPRLEQIPPSPSKPPVRVSPFKRKNQKAKSAEEQTGTQGKIGKEKLQHLRKFFESSSNIQGLSWRAIGDTTPENRAIPTPRASNLENRAQSGRDNTRYQETEAQRSVSNQNLESDHRIDCRGTNEHEYNVSQRPTCSTNIEHRYRCQQPYPYADSKRSPRISQRKDFHSEQRFGASGDASSELNRSKNSAIDQRPNSEGNFLDKKDSCETCKGTCLRQEKISEQSSSNVKLRSRSNNRLHELGKSLTNLLPPKRRSRSIEPLSQGERAGRELRQSQRDLARSPVSPQQQEKGVNLPSWFREGRQFMPRRRERQQNRSPSNLPNLPRSVSRENILHGRQKSPEQSAMHQPQTSPAPAPQYQIESSPIPAPQCLPPRPPTPSPYHRRQRSPISVPLYQQDRSPTPAPLCGQSSSQIPPLVCTQSRLPIPSLSYQELRSRISGPLYQQHWSATRTPQRGQQMSQIPVPLYQHQQPRAQISPLNPKQTKTPSPTAQQQNAPPKPPRLHQRIDSLMHQMSVHEHGEAQSRLQRERQDSDQASARGISLHERKQSPLPRLRRMEPKRTPLPRQQIHRQPRSSSLQRREQPSPSLQRREQRSSSLQRREQRSSSLQRREQPSSSLQRREQPSPSLQRREQPSPSLQRREQPSPSLQRREQPSPSLQRREQPSPSLQRREQPSPSLQRREQPSPSLQRREQPSPSLQRREPQREILTPQVRDQLGSPQQSLQDKEQPNLETDV